MFLLLLPSVMLDTVSGVFKKKVWAAKIIKKNRVFLLTKYSFFICEKKNLPLPSIVIKNTDNINWIQYRKTKNRVSYED